jgi:hypothetical protein
MLMHLGTWLAEIHYGEHDGLLFFSLCGRAQMAYFPAENLVYALHEPTHDLLYIMMQILDVPSLLEEGSSSVVKRNILKQKQENHAKHGGGCCQ